MNLFAKFQRMFAKISFIYGFGGKPTPRPLPEGKGVRMQNTGNTYFVG